MIMRLLFITAETWPTFRADEAALFGKYLPRLGVHADLVAGRTPNHQGPIQWGGGQAMLCDMAGGAMKRRIKTLIGAG